MRISEYDIESRKRINKIESALTLALSDCSEGATYTELLVALANMQRRWLGHVLSDERMKERRGE